jgi:hypothetical protein
MGGRGSGLENSEFQWEWIQEMFILCLQRPDLCLTEKAVFALKTSSVYSVETKSLFLSS